MRAHPVTLPSCRLRRWRRGADAYAITVGRRHSSFVRDTDALGRPRPNGFTSISERVSRACGVPHLCSGNQRRHC